MILGLISATLRMAGAVAPGPTSVVVRKMLFAPRKGRVRQGERDVLQAANKTSHEVDGETVFHYEWGSGDRRILLVHGWSGHAGQMTSFVQPLLDAGYHVIGLDLPGHGESTGKTASVIHFKKALKHAKQMYGEFYGVMAHSLGAASVALAISEGFGCEKVVFLAPVTRFDFIFEQSRQLLGLSHKVMDLTVLNAEKWLGIHFDEISPENLAPNLDADLLVLHDKGDREVPFSGGQKLADCWPNAKMEVTEELGHVKLLHHPDVIAKSVKFLERGDN